MAMTPENKASATTMTVTSRTATTMTPIVRAGQGWQYDEVGINYDSATDSEGREVRYDSLGQTVTMTPLSKNDA